MSVLAEKNKVRQLFFLNSNSARFKYLYRGGSQCETGFSEFGGFCCKPLDQRAEESRIFGNFSL
jgi:hypothetical protein